LSDNSFPCHQEHPVLHNKGLLKLSVRAPVKMTTRSRGKLTTDFAGEDFQFVCVQGVQKKGLFFYFTSLIS